MPKPFVNWDEIMKLAMGGRRPFSGGPGGPQRAAGEAPPSPYGMWDKGAPLYDQMAKMEAGYTLNQINCFETSPEDTVLDCGCGPGRIVVPMAKRAKSVTALDTSPKMLEFCAANAKAAGLTNVTTKLLDFNEVEIGKNLEKHDIVICSRSAGLMDLVKLSSMANKLVVSIIWAHGYLSIPAIIGKLFNGMEGVRGPGAGPGFMPPGDRRLGNNIIYNRTYDLGFNPNLKIVEDGFTKNFASREEAYADLFLLRSMFNLEATLPEEQMNIFKTNTDNFLTANADGTVTFLSKTKTVVMWWDPQREE
ncbi:MAG: class I SAM-dependent methyltransferase [Clostridiales bacterium]|nr:class I SAM-dependent methyltransferase [Clostridiales bacterium]